jgi:hypothetical protein
MKNVRVETRRREALCETALEKDQDGVDGGRCMQAIFFKERILEEQRISILFFLPLRPPLLSLLRAF